MADPIAEDFDPPQKPKRNKFAIACSLMACTTSILLGYDIGVMSGVNLFIKDDLKINDLQIQILTCTLNIYSVIGSALAGRTSDWIGRRYTAVLSGAIFFVGAILMGFAPGYAFLMFGRFVAGIGVGYGLMISPVYTAEIAPTLSVASSHLSLSCSSILAYYWGTSPTTPSPSSQVNSIGGSCSASAPFQPLFSPLAS
ncbi:hypothetical protein L3X38_043455 [Prunus dulcis]|uniref:Major facilitator superfamily (MFS) profile domain-containing protein n=1 Tax=Prunus dulcis TaxID=3755 RepID=A0AAD4UWW3_PRUDU|nr:hypothetical protein L3X38_043455 [Prunus dulcis]